MKRRGLIFFLTLMALYSGIGAVFHIRWKSAQLACREMREARGEFVEPEVFGGPIGVIFDITGWPVYAWANLYHYGTLFPDCGDKF